MKGFPLFLLLFVGLTGAVHGAVWLGVPWHVAAAVPITWAAMYWAGE